MTAFLSRSDVVDAIRAFRRISAAGAEIACDNIDAIPMRDALDLYLALAGGRDSVWCDPAGRHSHASGALIAGARIARDIVAQPWLLARHWPVLSAVERAQEMAVRPAALAPILFLRTDHWFNVQSGGSVGHLKGVVDNFRALEHQTHVVSSDLLTGVPADDHFHLCRPRYGTGRNLANLPELEYNRHVLRFVAKNWDIWQPRMIYQRLSLLNYAGAALKVRYGAPYVCEYNGSIAWIARNWDGRAIRLERLALRTELASLMAADLVVAVSKESRDELTARGVPGNRILVNPNGVDTKIFRPDLDASHLRANFGFKDMLVLGHISTFGQWHGAETLVNAYADLLQKRPDLAPGLRLLMIGDGVRRPASELIAQKRGVADQVVFTGRIAQAEASAHLAACDVLVSPHVPNPDGTPFFGSPTKLFEYMATGRPIIASDLNQIGELLRHGETAYMVPPGDAGALAAGLVELIENPELRRRLGKAARDDVVAKYTWRAHSERILTALDERLLPKP